MKKNNLCTFLFSLLYAAGIFGFVVGCDVESGSDVVRGVSVDFTGVYRNDNGRIVTRQTGATVTELNLRQQGDQLEAIDNNGLIFRGSLGSVRDGSATFNLSGETTVGQEVLISGTLNGENTAGTMRANWIEPTINAIVFAVATISPVVTNTVPGNGDGGANPLTIRPAGTISISVNNNVTFTAGGGTGNYQWQVNNQNLGFLSNTTGSTVTYTPSRNGTQRVTVTDGNQTQTTTVTH